MYLESRRAYAFSFARVRGFSREDADDFAQDSVIAFWLGRRQVRQHFVDFVRTRNANVYRVASPNVFERAIRESRSPDLFLFALERLDTRLRTICVLRFVWGCKFTEIGPYVGLSKPAARQAYLRALDQLRVEPHKTKSPEKHAEIRRMGGKRISQNRAHMAEIGRKGGIAVAQNREYMAEIGSKGGSTVRK